MKHVHRTLLQISKWALLSLLAVIPATAHAQISGMAEEPRLAGIDTSNPAAQSFTFKGFVNYKLTSSDRLEIWVLTDGNGDSTNDLSWAKAYTVTSSSQSGSRFNWTTGPITVFTVDSRWLQGGTARIRFKAFKSGSPTVYLPVRDSDGKQGNDLVLVLSDSSPDPSAPAVGPEANWLAKKSLQFSTTWPQATETAYYYDHTIVDTAQTQTITSGLGTLAAFRARYFGPIVWVPGRPSDCATALSTPETVATYFNKGDLGIGREMHCIDNACTREIACYVGNYAGKDNAGKVIFDDKTKAKAAYDAHAPFATVAMVERQWMGPNDPNQVLFAVFDPPGKLFTGPVALDSKGFNTFNPGNCLACHGTSSTYTFDNSTITGAYFLPFDLQALEYYSSTSSNPLSRVAQEGSFRKLNFMMEFSDLFFLQTARHLIEDWYGGWTRSTFKDDVVPAEWNTNTNDSQLYKNVVAKACRTCHVSDESDSLAFQTPADFSALKTLSYGYVCGDKKYMPQAEQTFKVMWRSSARSHFLNRLGLTGGCKYEAPVLALPEFIVPL